MTLLSSLNRLYYSAAVPTESHLAAEVNGRVAWLRLDKPARLNALDSAMLTAVEDHFRVWADSGDIAVAVIASTSPRAFCVGADLEVLSRLDTASMAAWESLGNRVLDLIRNSPLISIAAIPGFALGGGLTLAAACDLRVAAHSATFAQPEIELGWIPGWGGVARLTRLVGPARAKDLSLTGRRITASEALDFGLVDRLVADADLDSAVAALAARVAAAPPAALRAIKALAEHAAGNPHPLLTGYDSAANAALLHNPLAQQAIAAFLSRKRGKPDA